MAAKSGWAVWDYLENKIIEKDKSTSLRVGAWADPEGGALREQEGDFFI